MSLWPHGSRLFNILTALLLPLSARTMLRQSGGSRAPADHRRRHPLGILGIIGPWAPCRSCGRHAATGQIVHVRNGEPNPLGNSPTHLCQETGSARCLLCTRLLEPWSFACHLLYKRCTRNCRPLKACTPCTGDTPCRWPPGAFQTPPCSVCSDTSGSAKRGRCRTRHCRDTARTPWRAWPGTPGQTTLPMPCAGYGLVWAWSFDT